MIMLLLITTVVMGRALHAYGAWGCVEAYFCGEHHECCSCECEFRDCDYHTQSLEGDCNSHEASADEIATIVNELKVTAVTYIVICSLLERVNMKVEPPLYSEFQGSSYALEWICDVGLLRAPPAC